MARGGSTDVRQMLLQVDASVVLAQRNLNQLAAQVQRDSARMDTSLSRVDAASARVGGAFGRLNSIVGTLGVSLGGLALVNAGRSMLNFADDLEAAADRAGVGIERYQTLRDALRTLEVPAQAVDKIFERLLSTLGDVQNGADSGATQALDRLGIKARILNGEIDSSDELLDAIAASSRDAGTQAQFASEMAEIFGRRLSGQLVPALYDGGTALHELEQALRDTGSVVDEETIRKFAEAEETVTRFFEATKRHAVIWAAAVIDAFDSASSSLLNLMDRMGDGANTGWLNSLALLFASDDNRALGSSTVGEQNAGINNAMRSQMPGGARGPRAPNAPNRTRTSSGSAARTDQQIWQDFQRELAARGIIMTPGGGFRTAGQQAAIHARGDSPLDGVRSPSRHQAWQAFDPLSRTHNETAAIAAANAAGLRGFRIVPESRGRIHYEWTGAGRRGELDFSGAAAAEIRVPDLGDWEGPSGGVTVGMMEAAQDARDLEASLSNIKDIMVELPIPIEVLTEEDQERLERFAEDFAQGLADGLAAAIVYGEDLGDALVDTIRRAAAELISSSLMDLLTGRSGGDSMIGQLAGSIFGFGPAGGGVKLGPGKAGGGDVFPGSIYPVGERGVELFAPKTPGVIIPNHALGGGTSRVVIELPPELDARIARVSGPVAIEVVRRSAPSLSQAARDETIAFLVRPELG